MFLVLWGSWCLQQGDMETRSVPETAFDEYVHSLRGSESQRVVAGRVCVALIDTMAQSVGSDTHWEGYLEASVALFGPGTM